MPEPLPSKPKPEHTPGPWARNIRAGGKYPTVYAGPMGHHSHVAHVCRATTPEETEANIDLIAAAPTMLDTLEKVRDSLRDMAIAARRDGVPIVAEHCDTIRDEVEATIAQAEGEG
jgi:hypothetical protein